MPAPLSPEQLAEASKRLDKLTQSLEDSILEDICRRIAKAGAVTDTAEYQLMRLKEMGYANSFIEKSIADYMQKSEVEIRQLFFEAAQVSSDFYEKYYMQNGKAAVPLEDNEYMQQLISAGIDQTKGELKNFTQSMGFAVKQPDGSLKFQPVAKAYQSCLDLAHSQVATGVFDYNTAIRNATAGLTAKGLQFVDYASGHRNRADVAVRRAVLTGIGQMAARVAEKAMDDLGTEYVEVTAHAGARPDHAKWQGRIYHWDRKNNAAQNTEKPLDNGGGSGIMKEISPAKTAEEAYKMLVDVVGFGKVEDSFKTLNPELSVAATNQLINLEKTFGVIAKSTNTTIFAEDAPGAGAFVRRATYCNPAEQRLSLCPKTFGLSKLDFEALVREKRDKKWFMPFSDGEESEYLVTHEYGHMIQNILVQQRMIQKGLDLSTPDMFVNTAKLNSSNKNVRKQAYAWYINIENEVAEECFREIFDIAKARNPNFVFAQSISKYGGSGDRKEFFAETFANSQLGAPNELGEAMKIWLERKGLTKK